MGMSEWVGLIQTFGVAIVVLIFVGWCLVKIAPWIATRIDKIIDRAFQASEKVDKFDDRIQVVETRVETLWAFQLRRAAIEVMNRGIGKVNSPVVISDEAKSWMASLAEELKAFYRQMGRNLSTTQLAEEIERRWGAEIVKQVCIPHGLFQGACLLIAMEVAREAGKELDQGAAGGD